MAYVGSAPAVLRQCSCLVAGRVVGGRGGWRSRWRSSGDTKRVGRIGARTRTRIRARIGPPFSLRASTVLNHAFLQLSDPRSWGPGPDSSTTYLTCPRRARVCVPALPARRRLPAPGCCLGRLPGGRSPVPPPVYYISSRFFSSLITAHLPANSCTV